MLTIIGPAKNIKIAKSVNPASASENPTQLKNSISYPAHLQQAEELVNIMRTYSPTELSKLMAASIKIAELNFERYLQWNRYYDNSTSIPAILGFNGEVFNGLQAGSLNKNDLDFAQEHLRILSGLYGVLKPMDLILPYRLEMGTKLQNKKGKNLYDYWEDIIPHEIIKATEESDGNTLINLASNEYFKSIKPTQFPYEIITPIFKEEDENGNYRNVTIYAKKARGLMLRFILQHKINDPENIKAFDEEGYYFNVDKSGEREWWFTRPGIK